MGTSSSYGGPGGGTPLVPSWVDAEASAANTSAPPLDAAPGNVTAAPDAMLGTVPQPPADAGRFTAPRGNMTRFATSGGTDRRSLGRAVSSYVSGAAGGAASAARRLGASRRATASLLGFLSDVQARGVPAALRALNLEALVGRSVEEIFLGLADFVCPVGGTIDDGIARDAFIETIAQLADEGITDLTILSMDQMQTVFEIYATHAIEARLCNDIGAKMVALPASAHQAAAVEAQLRDFIRRGVADALAGARTELATLTTRSVLQFVDEVYASAFEILRVMGDAEEGR
jgi:hypothetical protein